MQNTKKEKIIIVGKSGSGKDHLLRGLIKKGLKYSPKYTTRPKRSNETDGVEYFFIDNIKFNDMSFKNLIKTYQFFNINGVEWIYMITKENFQNNQVFIMTPHEISGLNEEDRKNSFIVYLDISLEIRRERISGRNDHNDSVNRRLESDDHDFQEFSDYDLKITDPNFDIDMVYDLMN